MNNKKKYFYSELEDKVIVDSVIAEMEKNGIKPKEIIRQVEKKHIFTHIEWHMNGIFLEVKECSANFVWMRAEQIEAEAALPTAFRQFWEEIAYV